MEAVKPSSPEVFKNHIDVVLRDMAGPGSARLMVGLCDLRSLSQS